MTNANLPPLQINVHNNFILTEASGTSEGTLVGVRALMNQALQFTVLLSDGALYTGLPINALTRNKDTFTILPLGLAQAFDCIGSDIEVITFDLLRYMNCRLKTFTNVFYDCKYLFSLDFKDQDGLARHPVQWKQYHILENSDGNLMCYPQYRIQFKDKSLCINSDVNFKEYKYNETVYLAEN